MALDRAFSPAARAAATARLHELGALAEALPPQKLQVALMQVMALADNGHSRVDPTADGRTLILPVRVTRFAEGFYVMRAPARFSDLVGGRVDSIDAQTIDQILSRLETLRGGVELKPFGKYAIEGVIGVLHDRFESLWKLRADRQPITPGFGVVLNVVNHPRLRKWRYVDLDHIDQQIRGFCATVADLLNQLPQNEEQLFRAYQVGELAGMPLRSFAGYTYRTKFDAFGQFVQQLQGARSA